jgi:diguanylate cyclase (GGDEF)-like protein/PAS domain S-box-containing protein
VPADDTSADESPADPSLDEIKLAAMDTSPDGILLFDNRGVIAYANAACSEVFGRGQDELVGSNIAEHLHPEDAASAAASMRSFTGEGAKARVPSTMRFRLPDGTWTSLAVNGNPVDTPGRPRMNLMIARRADFLRLMTEALNELSGTPDLHAMLTLLPQMIRMRVEVPVASVVWRDDAGELHLFGDALDPRMNGVEYDDVPGSPFTLAWDGKQQTGEVEDLPPDLRSVFEAHGLGAWWLVPIAGTGGDVQILVTIGAAKRGHNEPYLQQQVQMLTNLAHVSLHFSQQHSQLVHDARHDSLTGLVNRGAFHDALHRSTDATDVAVIYVDLDEFKPVNDRWGHEAGDLLLTEVARRLSAACRVGDLVARLGGDEFAVLSPGCTTTEAIAIGERFLAALEAPVSVGRTTTTVGASVGVAVGPADDRVELARRADDALYRAKGAGGHRVEVAPER